MSLAGARLPPGLHPTLPEPASPRPGQSLMDDKFYNSDPHAGPALQPPPLSKVHQDGAACLPGTILQQLLIFEHGAEVWAARPVSWGCSDHCRVHPVSSEDLVTLLSSPL